MKQKEVAWFLKILIIALAVCGAGVYFGVVPIIGTSMVQEFPEFSYCYYPWLFFLWATGVPCYLVLALSWKIADNIGRDRAFVVENAKCFALIEKWILGDSVFFLIMNILYGLLGMNHPGFLIGALFVSLVGAAFAICAKALSVLVEKAAQLQEQSDWTI